MARDTRGNGAYAPEREGGRVVLYLILGLMLLAGAGYAAAYLGASDKLPVGTTVAGVDVGGHSPSSAAGVLREGLRSRARTPFTVRIGDRVEQISPHRVGLGVDYVASVHQAGAAPSWHPSRLWDYYTNGQRLDPVVTLDQLALNRLVTQLNKTDARPAVDGAVTFLRGRFEVQQPVSGRELDPQATAQAFWDAYLTDDPSVDLALNATPADIDSQAVHRFVRHFANRAMAAPITLTFGRTSVRLRPSDYLAHLGSRAAGHRLEPTADAAALDAVVQRKLGHGGPANSPVDATVALVNGQPQVVHAQPGVTFNAQDVSTALVKAIRSDRRTAKVPASLAPASFTDADARKLEIRDLVSSSTVHLLKGGRPRALIAGANKVDNTVVKPGGTFSLRQVLGNTALTTKGGTALATAVFDAAWLGGLEIGTHASTPTHTGQYPLGRDATLADGQDLVFTDNLPYGVLVSVAIGAPTPKHGGSLIVTLWSKPRWTVTSSHGARTNVVPAGVVVHRGRRCQRSHGSDGFDIEVSRTITDTATGAGEPGSSYTVHYAPVTRVVCAGGIR